MYFGKKIFILSATCYHGDMVNIFTLITVENFNICSVQHKHRNTDCISGAVMRSATETVVFKVYRKLIFNHDYHLNDIWYHYQICVIYFLFAGHMLHPILVLVI
jgi:hypothetical protein